MSAETVLGIADTPGHLLGYGPIGPGQARRIAHLAGITWRRVLTDPATGVVLDHARTTHTPPAALADHVLARHGWDCTRPGCAHRGTDLDHATAWAHGGATAATNLHLTCQGCHTAKHTGWTVHLDHDGGAHRTSPHGAHGHTRPTDLRPEDRHPPTRASTPAPAAPDWLAELRRWVTTHPHPGTPQPPDPATGPDEDPPPF